MIYEYLCPDRHVTEKMRKVADRHDPVECSCGKPASLIISKTHRQPDGIYSYAPNSGDPNTFERRHEMLRRKQRLGDGTG
jgi:hypothetical protein